MTALALGILLTLGQEPEQPRDDAPYVVSDRPVDLMSRGQLRAEYAQLDAKRPGLGGPITMVAVGGGLIVYGGFLLLVAAGPSGPSSLFTSSSPLGYLFVTMLAVGAGLLIPGIWLWWNRRDDRAVMGERMDAISARLEELDRIEGRRREDEYPERRERVPPPPGIENYQL